MSKKVNVLFVCLGNICRSPMAEAVFRNLVKEEQLEHMIDVDSAGTGDWHIGKVPHEGTRQILDRQQISYEGMKARQIKPEDEAEFQYIVCMDNQNLADVKKVFGKGENDIKGKTITFMSLIPDSDVHDVPDPYYTGNFDYVYELIEAGSRALLNEIKETAL